MTDRRERARQIDLGISHQLAVALASAGKPRRDIAREIGIHRDSLHRIACGRTAPSLGLATCALEACGTPPIVGLLAALSGGRSLGRWVEDRPSGEFLERLIVALPCELTAALGDRTYDVRPSWALGTARLIGRTLVKHVDDIAERAANPVGSW
ncbi:MAG: helix-turn-helix transcriptional regulator [Novosphingobium sp.]